MRFYIQVVVKKEVLSALLDNKKINILKTILNNNDEQSLNEIAKNSNVSLASTFRLLREFVALDLIEKKVWKNNKTYLSRNNEKTTFLKELLLEEFDGLQAFLSRSSEIQGINKIVLHGKASKNKANLILIGENIDIAKTKLLCSEIKAKGFNLSFIPLAPDQYEQMVEMGLYSGEKTVLKS